MSDPTAPRDAAPPQPSPALSEQHPNTPPPAPPAPAEAPPGDGAQPAAPAPAEAPQEADAPEPPGRPAVIARYGAMRHIGQFRHNLEPPPRRGQKVVVRTERGVELAEVVAAVAADGCDGCLSCRQVEQFTEASGPDYPLRRGGKILRLANPQDEIDYRHLESSAREEAAFCRQQIRETGMGMKLVAVEHLLGGERIIFYFCAEHRVDFRELVRRLASQYHTRIEMRQVGARDEARLVADLERCGQPVCCRTFLKDLKPVSMRMAKTQKATLDPSKISGRCGRLMCCLRYEDVTYEQLKKLLPRRNTWVRTEQLLGRVVDGQILTQLVRVQLPDGTFEVVANEQIVERNVPPPPMPEPTGRPGERVSRPPYPPRRPAPAMPPPAPEPAEPFEQPEPAEMIEPAEPGETDETAGQDQAPAAPEAQVAPVEADQAPAQAQPQQFPAGKRKRHRRHKKRHGGGQAAAPQAPPPGQAQRPAPQGQAPAPGPPAGQSPGGQRKKRRRRGRRSRGGEQRGSTPPPAGDGGP